MVGQSAMSYRHCANAATLDCHPVDANQPDRNGRPASRHYSNLDFLDDQPMSAAPTFRPTLRDCEGSWEDYISRVEPSFQEVGICKVIPPKSWRPSHALEEREVTIKRPIEQKVTGRQGVFRALLLAKKEMSLQKEFKPAALQSINQPPAGASGADLEREFWRSLHRSPPIYGADVEASFFDTVQGWNLQHLDSLLTRVLEDRIPGVNTPYLYFGMWRSFFGWHTEDMELHSVNYLHHGAPKQWYCIPPAHRERFETWVRGLLPDCFQACSEFFRHKELLISPQRLRDASIPLVKVVQQPGEMVVTYPGAYHSGFNCGFNCAESTNFATRSWIEHGAEADCCLCREDVVNIDMRRFLAHADEQTREVIQRNFVSDSEASTCDTHESQASAAAASGAPHDSGGEPEASTSESEVDDDNSPDYRAGPQPRSSSRRASSMTPCKRRAQEGSRSGSAGRQKALNGSGQCTTDRMGASCQDRGVSAREATRPDTMAHLLPAAGTADNSNTREESKITSAASSLPRLKADAKQMGTQSAARARLVMPGSDKGSGTVEGRAQHQGTAGLQSGTRRWSTRHSVVRKRLFEGLY